MENFEKDRKRNIKLNQREELSLIYKPVLLALFKFNVPVEIRIHKGHPHGGAGLVLYKKSYQVNFTHNVRDGKIK